MTSKPASVGRGDIAHPSAIPFLLIHVGCFGAVWSGITWQAVALGAGLYLLRMFAITAGYHRYFSHRSYSTGRVFQFVLAFLAQSAGQKSVLWWAAHHRHHHLHSDTEDDVHSPRRGGFIHSHIGWILDRGNDATDLVKVDDIARYPELRWLHKYEGVPPTALAILCFAVAGWPGLVVGFCWSTVLVYHATFCINSLAHVHGSKRYVTGDDSRNNPLLAIVTLGEGWHNNHHAYQGSARQGFRRWEVDLTYYALKMLAVLGVVSDLRTPPAAVLRNEQRLGGRVLRRTADELAGRFEPEATSDRIRQGVNADELVQLTLALNHPDARAAEILGSLPDVPGRRDFVRQARRLFTATPSFDDIVDLAREQFLRAVGDRLARPAASTVS